LLLTLSFPLLLDYVDLVTLIVREVPEADLTKADSSVLTNGKLTQIHCDSVADLSKRNPYLPVEGNAPLLRVLELMVRNRTQRERTSLFLLLFFLHLTLTFRFRYSCDRC
jgi:hypothetical protein